MEDHTASESARTNPIDLTRLEGQEENRRLSAVYRERGERPPSYTRALNPWWDASPTH